MQTAAAGHASEAAGAGAAEGRSGGVGWGGGSGQVVACALSLAARPPQAEPRLRLGRYTFQGLENRTLKGMDVR